MTSEELDERIQALNREAAALDPDMRFNLVLDLQGAILLITQLELALTHPVNQGRLGKLTRGIMAELIRLIEDVAPEHGKLARLGAAWQRPDKSNVES